MKNQFVVDVRVSPNVGTKKTKATQRRKDGPFKKNIDAHSYITSPQTNFQKDSTSGVQFASEDVSATQRESWRAQKHYLEKSPSTLIQQPSQAMAPSKVKTIRIHLKHYIVIYRDHHILTHKLPHH